MGEIDRSDDVRVSACLVGERIGRTVDEYVEGQVDEGVKR